MIACNILPSSSIANMDIPSAPHVSYASEDQFFTPIYHPDKEPDLDEIPIYFAHGSEWLFDSDTDPEYPPIYYGNNVEFIAPPTWRDDLEAFVKSEYVEYYGFPDWYEFGYQDKYSLTALMYWCIFNAGPIPTKLYQEVGIQTVNGWSALLFWCKCHRYEPIPEVLYVEAGLPSNISVVSPTFEKPISRILELEYEAIKKKSN